MDHTSEIWDAGPCEMEFIVVLSQVGFTVVQRQVAWRSSVSGGAFWAWRRFSQQFSWSNVTCSSNADSRGQLVDPMCTTWEAF